MGIDESEKSQIDLLTERIIGCAYAVSNLLGSGFLEKVYENSMKVELESAGLQFQSQKTFSVKYKDKIVGDYIADMIVENQILVELKAIKAIENVHIAQTINYLKVSGLDYGLILNFGNPKVEIKRLISPNT